MKWRSTSKHCEVILPLSILYDAIKSVSLDYDKNRVAAGLLFGTVRAADPLRIEIDSRIVLTETFLTVAQHLTDYAIDCESSTDEINGFVARNEGDQIVDVLPGLQKGRILLKNKLLPGQRVILARMEGGHQYIVLDRIGSPSGQHGGL